MSIPPNKPARYARRQLAPLTAALMLQVVPLGLAGSRPAGLDEPSPSPSPILTPGETPGPTATPPPGATPATPGVTPSPAPGTSPLPPPSL